MSRRLLAWERHDPWVSQEMLAYVRFRVPPGRDSEEALEPGWGPTGYPA